MHICVWCESDQELLGVERITKIEIERTEGNCDAELSLKVHNKLAGKEYFTDEDDWRDLIKQDIVKEVGCNIADVEII